MDSYWISVLVLISSFGCAQRAAKGAPSRFSLGVIAAAASEGRQENVPEKDVASGTVLTREELVRRVLANNPSVQAARAAWRSAKSRRAQREGWEDPMVSYSFAPLSIGSEMRYGQTIELSQKFPWPGKLSQLGEEADAAAQSDEEQYRAVRLDLALAASLLLDDYYVVTRSLEINAHHRALVEQISDSAKARYSVGRGSLQDPLQAETERAELDQEAILLRTELRVVKARINALLHRAPDEELPPPPARLEVLRDEPSHAKNLQQKAVSQRTELRIAQADIRRARARKESAERAYYPDLTVMVSYSSMWDAIEHQFMLGVSAPIPLQRASRASAVTEAEADAERARHELARQTTEVQKDVEIARLRLVQALEVAILHERRLLPLARDRLAAARSGFESDANDFGVLVEAENNLRKRELELHVALASISKARAELARAMGELPISAPEGRTR